jgi:hypothetical protein
MRTRRDPGREIQLKFNDTGGFEALVRLDEFEFDAVAFLEGLEALAADHGEVNEDILSSLILGDETETFFVIEPFDDTISHVKLLPCRVARSFGTPLCASRLTMEHTRSE